MKPFAEPFLGALLRNASEGVVVHDDTGAIVFCNAAAERLLGLPKDAMVGATSHDLEYATVREDGSPFPADEHPAMVTLRTGQTCDGVVMGIRYGAARSPLRWISINSAMIPERWQGQALAFAVFADITPHIEAKQQLREAAARLEASNAELEAARSALRGVLRAIPDPTWLKDPNGVYTLCNKAFERFCAAAEGDIIGHTDFDLASRDDATRYREDDRRAVAAGEPVAYEQWVTHLRTGSRMLLETVKTPLLDADGALVGVLGIARDITARYEADRRLADLMAFQQGVLQNSPVGIIILDLHRVCVEANEAAGRLFGVERQALIGQTTRRMYRDEQAFRAMGERPWPIMRCGGTFCEDLPMQRFDGTPILLRHNGHLIDVNQPELGAIVCLEDVTAQRALEETLRQNNETLQRMTVELRALARTDALTGLANRRAFNEAIELEFRRCRRFATSAAVLMMDIDHFKKINDTHGHDAGDAALVELGRVLTQATRAFDVTARLGGEEFVMLVPGTDIPGAIALAERLRLMVAGMELHSAKGAFCMSASIGVTAFARGDCDWAEVLARADRALYQAKSLGRNRVVATRVEDTA